MYTECFPIFINWYPESRVLYLPSNGRIAFTLRSELAEATAKLILQGGHNKQIVLLTALETVSFSEIVKLINETTNRHVRLEIVSPEHYVQQNGTNDPGKKPAVFYEMLVSWYDGIAKGDVSTTDPLMKKLLGREPTDPRTALRQLLQHDPDYTWHQNYADQGQYHATLKRKRESVNK